MPTAQEVIARRDAISPACEEALDLIHKKLTDSEWVRAFSSDFQIFFPSAIQLTKGDVAYVEQALLEAGYVDCRVFQGQDDDFYAALFSLPSPKDLL